MENLTIPPSNAFIAINLIDMLKGGLHNLSTNISCNTHQVIWVLVEHIKCQYKGVNIKKSKSSSHSYFMLGLDKSQAPGFHGT